MPDGKKTDRTEVETVEIDAVPPKDEDKKSPTAKKDTDKNDPEEPGEPQKGDQVGNPIPHQYGC